jgi:hypothetical protein
MPVIKEAYEFIKKCRARGVAALTMEWEIKKSNIKEGDYVPLYYSDERVLFCFRYIPWTQKRYLKLEEIAKRYNLRVSKDASGLGYYLLKNGEERVYVTHAAIFMRIPPHEEEEKLLKELGGELFGAKSE